MCVDFRRVNEVKVKDSYPLLCINDLLDNLNGMKYFTSLDQANAYNSIPVAEEDKHKTAFNMPIGLYQYNYLPFGLCNSAASFQRLMDVLLSELQWQTCLIMMC